MSAKLMSSIKNRKISNDKIYTPPKIVDIMIDFCGYKEGDNVLEPAKGLGAIYDKLKSPKDYCEIEEGKDYFDYNKKVEWIITNPPYSLIDNFLKKNGFEDASCTRKSPAYYTLPLPPPQL